MEQDKKRKSTNVVWHTGSVKRSDREQRLSQRGVVLWLTGLSASGKSTLAVALEERLFNMDQLAYVLDGDNIRHGLNRDLGFSPEDRTENIRRIGEVASLMADVGIIAITAFISPYISDRDKARSAAGPGRFLEVFLDTPLDVCEDRDPKGLYKRARAGEVPEFTGISAPYEPPEKPELVLDTSEYDVDEAVDQLVQLLQEREFISYD